MSQHPNSRAALKAVNVERARKKNARRPHLARFHSPEHMAAMRAARDRKRAIEREFPILTPREVPVETVREAENATPDTATPVAPAISAEVPPVWSESEEPARVTRLPPAFRTGQMLDLLGKCDFAPPGMGEREARRPRVPWDREATI